jgi:hypothetical protein
MVRKEKPQGYHWAELVRPVTELEDHRRDEDEDGQSLERMHDELTQAARRPEEQPREDRPQLDQEQRDGDRAAEDVQPLRELVEAHWAGRQRQPARRVLQVAPDAGQEGDGEGDAEPPADPTGDLGTAEPVGEVVDRRQTQRHVRGSCQVR